jgi:hypothetical protein
MLSKNQTTGECVNALMMHKKGLIVQTVIACGIESNQARASVRSPLCTKAVRLDQPGGNGVVGG